MELEEISFDNRVFSVEAVKNAAYRMARFLDSEIKIDGDQIVCTVKLRKGNTDAPIDDLLERFRREVIDHDLRLQISTETEAVRNLILAHAFSRTDLISSE
jgi:His-Xaa-Ser system protein HxsD